MSQLTSLEDLRDPSGYKKDLKKSLGKVQSSPAKMFYAHTFEFKGKRGPVVLVGELPSGLVKGLKEARVGLKTGRCRRNQRGEIEVFKGLEPAKIRVALKSAGIAETIADREVADETEDSPLTASEVRVPEAELENEESRKQAEATFKAREKDVLVEVQKFAAGHKNDRGALLGIKDVKSRIIGARELAAREKFDEANAALDRIVNAVRTTGPVSNAYGEEPPSSGEPLNVRDAERYVAIPADSLPAQTSGPATNAYGQEPPSSGEPLNARDAERYVAIPADSLPAQTSGPATNAYGQEPPSSGEPLNARDAERYVAIPADSLPAQTSGPATNAYGQEPPSSGESPAGTIHRPLSPSAIRGIPAGGQAGEHPHPPHGDARGHLDREFIEKMKEIKIPKGKFEDAAQTDANEFGFKTKTVGAEYVGEHEKNTWRIGVAPDDPRLVTRKYSDEERAQMTLDVDEGGIVRNADGSITDEKTEYTLDPKSGKMIKLPGTVKAVSTDPSTGETIRTTIPMKDVGKALKEGKRVEATHHSSALGGYDIGEGGQPVLKGVANAGSVTVKDGKVKRVSNASGHYKPKLVQILQTVEHLARQGAILDKTLVDAEGHKLGDAHPRAFALYGAVTKAQKNAKQYAAEARKIMARMDEVIGSTGEGGADEQFRTLNDELDRIIGKLQDIKARTDSAIELLHRIGAGPANRIDPEAKVEFTEGRDDISGLQFRSHAKTTISPADQFMKSGGGNQQQAANKNAMSDELKAKTAATRERLDREAIATEAAGPMPTEDEFDKALKDLES